MKKFLDIFRQKIKRAKYFLGVIIFFTIASTDLFESIGLPKPIPLALNYIRSQINGNDQKESILVTEQICSTSDIGCTLGLEDLSGGIDMRFSASLGNSQSHGETKSIYFYAGCDYKYRFDLCNPYYPKLSYQSFPKFCTQNSYKDFFPFKDVSPYSFAYDGSNLFIKGNLFDYSSNKFLGWFDENEFEILKSDSGGCAYSFNKDNKGIEILNDRLEVCFSLDIENEIIFKGYFVGNDGFIYIFNDDQYVTDDIDEARKLIREITPIFDHKELSNTTGKRLVPLLAKI